MAKTTIPAKTKTARKGKGNPNPPNQWRKGQSGNPKGAPKRGESWGEIINRVFSMTGAEIADYTMPLAKQLRTIGDTVTLKEAVILRVGVALMNEPTPGLFNAVMDRVEGTPRNQVEVSGPNGEPLAAATVIVLPNNERDTNRAAGGAANGVPADSG